VKGKKLIDVPSGNLTDDELDMQIGAIAEELEHIDNEVGKLDRVRGTLADRKAALLNKSGAAKVERGRRGPP
jgi:hypothetical protein